MSQQELAQKMGVSPSAISHWENGRRVPDANVLIAMSKALGCKLNDLIKED
jgi:transcriptional regulator with XRE-family HTH domain